MGLIRIGLACLLLGSVGVYGQETERPTTLPEMVPADLGPGLDPWGGRVRFPKGSDDIRVFIRCQGWVGINGRIESLVCDSDNEDTAYARAVNRAARGAIAKPAIVDGQRREVFTVFSVFFLRQDNKETIALFQNQLQNRDRYGVDYIAPQLYLQPPRNCSCSTNQNYVRRYTVGVDGTATLTAPESRCQPCFDSYAAGARFIPARADGHWVEAIMDALPGPRPADRFCDSNTPACQTLESPQRAAPRRHP